MSIPTSATTPPSPISIPTKRERVGCSPWSKRSARKATTSGTAAIRIAASEDDTRCSPNAISGNGIVISNRAKAVSQRSGSPRSAPLRHAIGSSTSAASATRDQATKPGDRSSSTAILMNRYGTPQTTETAANRIQPRGVMRSLSAVPQSRRPPR